MVDLLYNSSGQAPSRPVWPLLVISQWRL